MEPSPKYFKKILCILPIVLLTCTLVLYFSLEKTRIEEQISEAIIEHTDTDRPIIKFEAKRIIHLDLKGAPPKISYYESIFPLFSKLGANSILIEYEDMFPYTGNILENISARNAYSLSDIEIINSLAEENNLTIIPLVQTFGHLEFILKLRKFHFLRELSRYPQVICPTHNMTLVVLGEMIRQIIQKHPKSTMIHIGADEVYHIGKCNRCKRLMTDLHISSHHLFLTHIKRIASHIKLKYPNMKILMWDDEFRNIDEVDLMHSGLNVLIEPVVWKYTPNVHGELGYDLFDKYANVFDTLWFASAFKGATGSNQYLTPVSHHVANHESWMKIYLKYKERVSIGGIFITGWQRYDHFATLCELLPVGIPSLVFSFAVLSGHHSRSYLNEYDSFVDLLHCKYYFVFTNMDGSPYCEYPGADILDAVVSFHQFRLKYYNNFKERSSVLGWMTNYNSHHNFSNPDLVNANLETLHNFQNEIIGIDTYLSETMEKVYDMYTVSEWQETFAKPIYDDVNKMIKIAKRLLSVNDWPRRPL